MIPSLMPGFKSHHAESTCLGRVLPQEFRLASYEKHHFNYQMLRQDGVSETAGEGEHEEGIEETNKTSSSSWGKFGDRCVKALKGRTLQN